MKEFDIIRRYFVHDSSHESGQILKNKVAKQTDWLKLGIGDDAAILHAQADRELVISTDTLVAGRHFLDTDNPFDIGWKSLAVNLSDMAAMGAEPYGCLLSLTLPHANEDWLDDFARGFFALAEKFTVQLIGGDTTQGPLNIAVTILGYKPENNRMLRSGAQPGDAVWVSGTLGDAALALRMGNSAPESLQQSLHRPEPRVVEGLAVAAQANAAVDISDGLLADLGHIARASGYQAQISLESLPVSRAFEQHCPEAWRQACLLAGGDDYELCICLPEGIRPDSGAAKWTMIGRIVDSSSNNPLVTIHSKQGVVELATEGFEHFA